MPFWKNRDYPYRYLVDTNRKIYHDLSYENPRPNACEIDNAISDGTHSGYDSEAEAAKSCAWNRCPYCKPGLDDI